MKPLSAHEQEMRRPAKPEDLVGALHDYVHKPGKFLSSQPLPIKRIGMKTFCQYIQESEQESKPNVGRMKKAKPVELNIEGPTGFKIVQYEWAWKEDSMELKSGDVVPIKISDWDEASISSHTNRQIVHNFVVQDPKGDVTPVSLESAMKLLGYMSLQKADTVVRGKITRVKKYAKMLMELSMLEQQLEQEKAHNEKYKHLFDSADEEVKRIVNLQTPPFPEMKITYDAKGQPYKKEFTDVKTGVHIEIEKTSRTNPIDFTTWETRDHEMLDRGYGAKAMWIRAWREYRLNNSDKSKVPASIEKKNTSNTEREIRLLKKDIQALEKKLK